MLVFLVIWQAVLWVLYVFFVEWQIILWILLVLLVVWQSKTCGVVKPDHSHELSNSLRTLACNVPAALSVDLSSSKGSSLPVCMQFNTKQLWSNSCWILMLAFTHLAGAICAKPECELRLSTVTGIENCPRTWLCPCKPSGISPRQVCIISLLYYNMQQSPMCMGARVHWHWRLYNYADQATDYIWRGPRASAHTQSLSTMQALSSSAVSMYLIKQALLPQTLG